MRFVRIKTALKLLVVLVSYFFFEWSDFPRVAPDYFGLLGDYLPKDIESSEVKVKTDDGYVLNLFVLRHKTKLDESQPPVLFQHGFGNFGLSWLLNGEASGPVALCRKGFVVYLVNGRGTPVSLHHEWLDFRDERYWDFSFEDLGADVLAAADHVFRAHGQKLLYVGHSQGANLMLTALASPRFRQRLEDRFFLAHLFAPVICQKHAKPPASWGFGFIESARLHIRNRLGYATYGKGKVTDGFIQKAMEFLLNKLCKSHDDLCPWAFSNTERSNKQNNLEVFGTWNRYHPTSNPVKTMAHFGQIKQLSEARNCWVRRFDYGPEKNLEKYGSAEPPSFDFAQVRLPIAAYFGTEDLHFSQSDIEDFAALFRAQPNVAVVTMRDWGHVTFQVGVDLKEFFERLAETSLQQWRTEPGN